jgi:hypothetical protein
MSTDLERGARSNPRARQRARDRRAAKQRRVIVWAARIAALLVAFLVGLAVGKALEQAPRPGGSQTLVRTLQPTTLTPPETVTVTVSNP